MGIFRIGRSKREIEEEKIEIREKTENIIKLREEFKAMCSKPISDRELLENIYRELYKIRLKLETL